MKRTLTSSQYFQTVLLTYYLQAFSLLLFSGVVMYIISRSGGTNPVMDDKRWSIMVPFVLILGIASAYFIFRLMVKKISPSDRLQAKCPKYASALIVRSALLELPGLFAAIVAYLTLQPYFLGGSVMMFLIFLILRPGRHSMASDLNLSPRERELLEKPDAVISETGAR